MVIYILSDLPYGILLWSVFPALILGLLGLLLLRQKRWYFLGVLVVGVGGLCYWPHLAPIEAKPEEQLRLVMANALIFTDHSAHQAPALGQFNADIIALVEAHPNWRQQLPALSTEFPYHHFALVDERQARRFYADHYLILSKWPVQAVQSFSGQAKLYHIAAPRPFHLLLVHPLPPYNTATTQQRRNLLHTMTETIWPQPLIIAGDFNTVPWDKELSTAVKKQGWQYATSWLPTFHTLLPTVPIDHILLDNHTQAQHSQRIKLPGTDHFGQLVDLEFRN